VPLQRLFADFIPRSDPLQLWGKRVGSPKTKGKDEQDHDSPQASSDSAQVQEPHIEFMIDETLNSQVLELLSTHLPSTFITAPSLATRTLGIKLPILVFLVKNLGKYWSFEVTILDDRGEKRRFRASNFQVGPLFPLCNVKYNTLLTNCSACNNELGPVLMRVK
jgi:hypothetical protein